MATVSVENKKDQFLKIDPNTSVTIRVLPDRVTEDGVLLPSIVSGYEYYVYERDENGAIKINEKTKKPAVKPFRVPYNPKDIVFKGKPTIKSMIENDCQMREDAPGVPQDCKIFNAYFVWHFEKGRFKTFVPTQKNIVNELADFEDSPKYGDLTGYNIEIERTGGTVTDTKYKVTADKPEKSDPLPADVLEAWATLPESECDIMKLFNCEYPMTF